MPTKKKDVTTNPTGTKKARAMSGRKPKGETTRRVFSYYIQEHIRSQIENRAGKGASVSDCLNRDLTMLWRALDIGLAYAKQSLTKNEAKAILDVMNGTYWDLTSMGMMIGGGITINIQDGITLEQLDKKWGFDGQALATKLAQLDRLSTLAILEWARLFWIHHEELELEEHVNGFQEAE